MFFECCSFPLEGKDKAVEVGAVKALIPLLSEGETDVKAQAAAAIMAWVSSSVDYSFTDCCTCTKHIKAIQANLIGSG